MIQKSTNNGGKKDNDIEKIKKTPLHYQMTKNSGHFCIFEKL